MRHRRVLAGGVLAAVIGAFALAPGSADPQDPAESAPAASATAVKWDAALDGTAPCPEGTSRSSSLLTERFNTGIPQNRFNNGFYRAQGGLHGLSGRSDVDGNDPTDWMFTQWATAPVGARTMLAFATKGNAGSSLARVNVNSVQKQVAMGSGWNGRVYDITAATDDEGGRLGPWFEHKRAAGRSQTWWLESIQIYTCGNNNTTRFGGSDRYATSAKVSSMLKANVDVAYLSSGTSFPDALSGAALAAKTDSPVLLVKKGSIPGSVQAELTRLNPNRIVVLGGSSVVNDAVMKSAERFTRSGEVTRLSGADRYKTSAAIAATYPSGLERVYVATGRDYPDALAGGALAGRLDVPVIYTSPDGIPPAVAEQLERINPGKIVVLGGTSAVPEKQIGQLRQYTRSGTVDRIAGSDRYATSALIAKGFSSGLPRVFVATGQDFPDALSGAAVAGSQGVPVLLTRYEGMPKVVRDQIVRLDANAGVVLGGQSGVSPLVRDQLGSAVHN